MILIEHVDDILTFSREKLCIYLPIKSLFEGDENFEMTDEGNIDKYLGVDIKETKMVSMQSGNRFSLIECFLN